MMSAEVVNGGGGDLKKKNDQDMVAQTMMSAEVYLNRGGGALKKNKVDMVQQQQQQQQQLPYLDENIITQILLKIPAESLFNTFRYVCKSWLNKISTHPDIHLNRLLPSKPPCLIIQNVDKENNMITCFFTLNKEGKIIEQFDDLNPVLENLWIRACCNGLILVTTYTNPPNDIYVVNPLTNHRLMLPPLLQPIDLGVFKFSYVKFVFIPTISEYKVILPGRFEPNSSAPLQGDKFIQIVTLSAADCYGSSNDQLQWRLVEVSKQILYDSVAINGILYWGTSFGNIVSFDANAEKFNETTYRHNDKRASSRGYWGLIEIGGILSTWSLFRKEHDDVKRFIVCVVKDYHEEEWIDKYSIPIDTDFMKLMDHHHPVLSIGNGEVIIFHSWEEKTMWALNVKLNQWWEVGNKNLKEKLRIYFQGFHVNNKPLPFESIFAIEG